MDKNKISIPQAQIDNFFQTYDSGYKETPSDVTGAELQIKQLKKLELARFYTLKDVELAKILLNDAENAVLRARFDYEIKLKRQEHVGH